MAINQIKEIVEIIESIAKTIGLFIGAIWVYLKFIRNRENHPKIEFNVDVRLLGSQNEKLIIEIIAVVENKGLVRHWINDFTCDVLILKATDLVEHGDERINHQILFNKNNPIKSNGESKRERIIWIPKDWYDTFIDSGIKQQYTYLTGVPDTTTFISIYSQFIYQDIKSAFQTSQKTFSVEQLMKNNNG